MNEIIIDNRNLLSCKIEIGNHYKSIVCIKGISNHSKKTRKTSTGK